MNFVRRAGRLSLMNDGANSLANDLREILMGIPKAIWKAKSAVREI